MLFKLTTIPLLIILADNAENHVSLDSSLRNCHGNFVPLKILVRDQFFQDKIVPPGSIFSEKNGPVLKILFRFTFSIVMNYYDVKECAKKQIGSNN